MPGLRQPTTLQLEQTSQKAQDFWNKVFVAFRLIFEKEYPDKVLSEARTCGSIIVRFKRSIAHDCKLMDAIIKKQNPIKSGMNEEAYRQHLNDFFIPQSTSGKSSFRFWDCLEYLSREVSTLFGQSVANNAQARPMEPAVLDLMDDVSESLTNNCHNDDDSDDKMGTGVETVDQTMNRPIGVKKAKRNAKQEKLVDKRKKTKLNSAVGSVSFGDQNPHPLSTSFHSFRKGMDTKAKSMVCIELAKLGLALNQPDKATKYFMKAEALLDGDNAAVVLLPSSDKNKGVDSIDNDNKTVSTLGETSTDESDDSILLAH